VEEEEGAMVEEDDDATREVVGAATAEEDTTGGVEEEAVVAVVVMMKEGATLPVGVVALEGALRVVAAAPDAFFLASVFLLVIAIVSFRVKCARDTQSYLQRHEEKKSRTGNIIAFFRCTSALHSLPDYICRRPPS
jgi:hypothetical protein